MKKRYLYLLIVPLLALVSCVDKYLETYTANSPIYMGYDELRSAVKVTPMRLLHNPGKIYFKDNYLFVVEKLQGIHVLDVSTPSNPKNLSFIEIPGCIDIVMKGNILYADSYVDLVALDLSDLSKVKDVNRVKNALSYAVPPTNNDYRILPVDAKKGVVVGWELVRERRERDGVYTGGDLLYTDNGFGNLNVSTGGISVSTYGKGGSMARFGLYDNYLYTLSSNNKLTMFNVSAPASPNGIGSQYVGWNVETMFIYNGHMFFGTSNGMLIFSLRIPTAPEFVSNFNHVTSCDPVVIQDNYAYITLRGGQACHGDINRLDVVKLSADYKSNQLVGSFDMTEPYGLGIDGNTLFVCDGKAGLKVYDATNKSEITAHQLAAFPNIRTYDVIPVNGYLFMVGADGFYLYNYSDISNITKVGYIPVVSDMTD